MRYEIQQRNGHYAVCDRRRAGRTIREFRQIEDAHEFAQRCVEDDAWNAANRD